MKLFKSTWFYVGIVFLLITFTTTFTYPLGWLDRRFSNALNLQDDAKGNFLELIPLLLFPLLLTWFLAKIGIRFFSNTKSR